MMPPNSTLPARKFPDSLPMALLRARESVMRHFRPGLRRHGVSEQQWRVLRALAQSGPLQVTELANATLLLAPSLSRILLDMQIRRLISRKRKDSDLRRHVIKLEPQGLKLIAKHAPFSEGVYQQIAARLGSGRLAQMFALLHELEQAMTQPYPRFAVRSKAAAQARPRRRKPR